MTTAGSYACAGDSGGYKFTPQCCIHPNVAYIEVLPLLFPGLK
jgi:hypothetical protein